MEVNKNGVQNVSQDFSVVEKHNDVLHEPTVQERANNAAGESLKKSADLFSPQKPLPQFQKKVSFEIPEKSEKASHLTASVGPDHMPQMQKPLPPPRPPRLDRPLGSLSEGPKRTQSPSQAKRMSQMEKLTPPPIPPKPEHLKRASLGAQSGEAIQKPAIDPAALEKAAVKGKPIIQEMINTEKGYAEGLNRLVHRDYNGKSVLSRLGELASPQDKAIIEKYRDTTRVHLKHSKQHIANMELATGKADPNYSEKLAGINKSYNKMESYIESNINLSTQFKDLQGALDRTKAKEPGKFAALEKQFKGGDIGKSFTDFASTPMQRLPRHKELTARLLDKGIPFESAEIQKLEHANAAMAAGSVELDAQLAKADFAKASGGLSIEQIAANTVIPTEQPHAVTQDILKQILSGADRTLVKVDKNGVENSEVVTAKDMKEMLVLSSGAIFSRGELEKVNIFAQFSLAFATANPAEKQELANTLKDILSSDASIPVKLNDKATAQGYINHFVTQCYKDGINTGADIAKLANEKLTVKQPAAALNLKDHSTNIDEIKSNLVQINKVYNLTKASPEDTYANIHNYLMVAVNNINLSELPYPEKPDLTPTIAEAGRRCDAVAFLVSQQILQSPNPAAAYTKASKALQLAQREESWGVVQALTLGLSDSNVDRLVKDKISSSDKKVVDDLAQLFGANQKVLAKMTASVASNKNTVPTLLAYVASAVAMNSAAVFDDQADSKTQVNSMISNLQVDTKLKKEILAAKNLANRFTGKGKDQNSFFIAAESISALNQAVKKAEVKDAGKTADLKEVFYQISIERRPRGSNSINQQGLREMRLPRRL